MMKKYGIFFFKIRRIHALVYIGYVCVDHEIIMQCSLGGVLEITNSRMHTHTDRGVTAINNVDYVRLKID